MMVPQQQRRRRRRAALVRTSERRVVVVRGPGGFGFTIAGQRPCVVSAVAAGGPAERSGLRAGDALLGVDGASVARVPHASVARLIAAAPSAISLSVAPRESPPTDTEDTEPDERARTRRRHPPPRRRPHPPVLHHPACQAAPPPCGVSEILQNLSRARLSPAGAARLECRAVVAYLGTIETPQASPTAAPSNVRTAVRKLRQERRPAAPILLCVLPNALLLRRPSSQILAQYPRERIIYAGSGSDADRRYFGLVTSAELSDIESVSHSCHVFAVDPRMAEHEAHMSRGLEFQITCTRDPVSERCLEFPPSAEYVVGVIRGMYSLPAADNSSPNIQQISKLAVKNDSPGLGHFSRCNRPVFRPRDRRQYRHEEVRVDGNEFVANSPQPSNHSEITTTSSNSDSGIGFHNDCRNIADRILVVDFANQQPVLNRFRPDMPRRPSGLVGCGSFDADGSFLSNTTPVVDGFAGQGRPLNLDDVILTNDLHSVRHVAPRNEEDGYNYNNMYGNVPSTSRSGPNGVVYDQVFTENECGHYELIPSHLDIDCEVDRITESFNSVEIYEERSRGFQSNESVENITVISGGTSKASMDSVSMYSSRSHEDTRPARRKHMQASLDDMLVLGMRDQPEGREKDDDNFVHPASVKLKIRSKSKKKLLSKTRDMLSNRLKPRARLSASAGDVTAPPGGEGAADFPGGEERGGADLQAAASEPDLRDTQSEQSSPFRRWTTGSGAGASYRHHDHRNMYNKQMSEGSSCAMVTSNGGSAGGVARWALGLEHLLADPPGAAAFTHFLNKEYASENIKFWFACDQYSKATDPTTRAQLASEIMSRHLEERAPEPVNVDAEARRLVRSRMNLVPLPEDLFKQAQQQIFNVLKFDSYPRFLRSAEHAACARADLRGHELPYCRRTPGSHHQEGEEGDSPKLKKSASNASERRRSGGSLLPWKRAASRDRAVTNHAEGTEEGAAMRTDQVADVVKSRGGVLCRVVLPDGATSVVPTSADEDVKTLVRRLLTRRRLTGNEPAFDVNFTDAKEGEPTSVDLRLPSSSLAGREVCVELRAVVRMELRTRCIAVRCRPNRRLRHVLAPVLAKYGAGGGAAGGAGGVVVMRNGCVLSNDTLMQELDNCRLTIVEVEEQADTHTNNALTHNDNVDTLSASSTDSSPASRAGARGGSPRGPGARGGSPRGPGAHGGSAGSGRVIAALKPGPPVHHHPPEFLDNLRETQRLRSAVPPPLPPKPRHAIV